MTHERPASEERSMAAGSSGGLAVDWIMAPTKKWEPTEPTVVGGTG